MKIMRRLLIVGIIGVLTGSMSADGFNLQKKAGAVYHDQCECIPLFSAGGYYSFDVEGGNGHFTPAVSDDDLQYPGTVRSDRITAQSKLALDLDVANCDMRGNATRLSGYLLAPKGEYVGYYIYYKTDKDREYTGQIVNMVGIPFIWREFDYIIDLTNFEKDENGNFVEELTQLDLVFIPPPNGSPVNIDEIRLCRYCSGVCHTWSNVPEVVSIKLIDVNENVVATLSGTSFSHTVEVDADVNKVKFDVTFATGQTITFNNTGGTTSGNHSVSGLLDVDAFYALNVSIGVDGGGECNKSAYNVTVKRNVETDGLKNVLFDPGTIIGGFDPANLKYNVLVPLNTSTVKITPLCGTGVKEVRINGVVVPKNQESGPLALNATPPTNITLQVTLVDNSVFVYTFTVTDIAVYWDPANALEWLEGSSPVITVRLTKALNAAATFNFTYVNVGSTTGADYTAGATSVTFNAHETEKTISGLAITQDGIPEGDDYFRIVLANAEGQTIIIKDNDAIALKIEDDDN